MATEILRMPLHVPDGAGAMPFYTAKRCCHLRMSTLVEVCLTLWASE